MSSVAGPDAYWTSYGYGKTGNRTTTTSHSLIVGGTDTVPTYTYPAAGDRDRMPCRW
ncbi:hypothetical protein [Catellatospora sp. NPDC049609]|uniref:hypothetical protein n=1 Tax=Catellatospora sp. NPDC049609 TaxID=3155505 RepID=UPI00341E2E29